MVLKILALLGFLFITSNLLAQEVKVMSYNIHHGRNAMGEIDLKSIAEVITNSGATIVGLQEVDSVCRRSEKTDQMKILAELTGMHYTFKRHFAYDGGSYGLGILSKFPISKIKGHRISSYSKNPDADNTLVFLTADVTLSNEKQVHFGTVHFDYRPDPAVRLQQSADVMAYLKDIDYPVILTGDLNAEPDKQEITNLYKMYMDTDSLNSFTFPAKQPVKKIDYVLVSRTHLKDIQHHEVINEPVASDHRPVIAKITLSTK